MHMIIRTNTDKADFPSESELGPILWLAKHHIKSTLFVYDEVLYGELSRRRTGTLSNGQRELESL